MALLDVARSDDRHTSKRLTAAPVIRFGTVRPPHFLAAKFREKYAQALGASPQPP